MWHLGYADLLDPDYVGPLVPNNVLERIGECLLPEHDNIDMIDPVRLQCQECVILTDRETNTDNSYEPNSDDNDLDVSDDLACSEDENSRDSNLSDVFTPCTPLNMSMTECRAQGMYRRRCIEKGSSIA